MNRKKKGLIILSFVLGVIYAGLLSFPDFIYFPGSQKDIPVTGEFTIVNIEIICKFRQRTVEDDKKTCVPYYYTIECIDGEYYSNGQEIDPKVIHGLLQSFTDFYECTESIREPSFLLNITFENEELMVLKSDSPTDCFTPWYIEYDGKLYLQYSGDIPTALLRIVVEIDKEEWDQYDKEVHWGCYPAEIPEEYSNKGTSDDFPRTEPAVPPEIEQEILWTNDLEEPLIDRPVYTNGHLFALTKNCLTSFDAQTGDILWKVDLKKENTPFTGSVLNYEGALFVGLDYGATVRVVKVDYPGNVLWEYEYYTVGFADSLRPTLVIHKDKLLILYDCITCVDTKRGAEIWRVHDASDGELLYDNLFFHSMGEESYYGLLDIDTGEEIWKIDRNYIYCGYNDGILYFDNEKEGKLVTLSVESLKENWSYPYGEEVPPGYRAELFCQPCEAGTFLLVYGSKTEVEYAKIVFLDKTGSKVWEYIYSKESAGVKYPFIENVGVLQDVIYLSRSGGFIEAFNIKNGENLWETEVRGYTRSSQICDNKIYVAADDCMVYCVDLATGEILWKLPLCANQCTTNRYYHCWCDCGYFIYLSRPAGGVLVIGAKNMLVAVSVK
ncbi:MAG: PQQ-binding-like beta-propeller repeat protein [Theionarchaea archaeon]|nr:PQQ-binding-like beta-propeller repeat protein [Theionarchaea archaeon]